jgi:hypothetical protein
MSQQRSSNIINNVHINPLVDPVKLELLRKDLMVFIENLTSELFNGTARDSAHYEAVINYISSIQIPKFEMNISQIRNCTQDIIDVHSMNEQMNKAKNRALKSLEKNTTRNRAMQTD